MAPSLECSASQGVGHPEASPDCDGAGRAGCGVERQTNVTDAGALPRARPPTRRLLFILRSARDVSSAVCGPRHPRSVPLWACLVGNAGHGLLTPGRAASLQSAGLSLRVSEQNRSRLRGELAAFMFSLWVKLTVGAACSRCSSTRHQTVPGAACHCPPPTGTLGDTCCQGFCREPFWPCDTSPECPRRLVAPNAFPCACSTSACLWRGICRLLPFPTGLLVSLLWSLRVSFQS